MKQVDAGNPSAATGGAVQPMLVSSKEAAAMLSLSARMVWSLTASHELPCVRVRRRVLYRPEDLRAFIDRHRDRRKPFEHF